MAEGVDVVADGGDDAEFVLEVALAEEGVADEGLAGGDVAVGLDPPAAGDLPAAFGDAVLDLLEHRGVVLLDPLVDGGGAGGEDELRRLGHPVQGGAEGGLGLLQTLWPLPEPDGIEVGVADHVEGDG